MLDEALKRPVLPAIQFHGGVAFPSSLNPEDYLETYSVILNWPEAVR